MDKHTIRSMAWDWITSAMERGLDGQEVLLELQDTKRFQPIQDEFNELIERAADFIFGDEYDDCRLDYTTIGG